MDLKESGSINSAMDWEAFGVIGLFTLALGILLYVPARIWTKRKLRTEPGSHPKLRLTKLGWVLISVSLLVLIGGLLMNDLAPESTFGQLMNTPKGRFFYLVIVAVIFWLIEAALKARGIKLMKEDSKST